MKYSEYTEALTIADAAFELSVTERRERFSCAKRSKLELDEPQKEKIEKAESD